MIKQYQLGQKINDNTMKIDAIKTQIVEIPFDKTITTAIHTMRSVGCVLLTIKTDRGISGEGYLFSLNAKNIKIYHERLSKVASLLPGEITVSPSK